MKSLDFSDLKIKYIAPTNLVLLFKFIFKTLIIFEIARLMWRFFFEGYAIFPPTLIDHLKVIVPKFCSDVNTLKDKISHF